MIGRLRGEVAWRAADHVMLDVGGVGYVVFCSDRTLAAMPQVGAMASLWTEMVVREDLMQLFGFLTVQEREWHRLLTSVQGVGAKVSLAILGVLGPDGVGRAIALSDAGAVKAAPGVGPKLATRVVNELQGKAPALMAMAGGGDDPLIEGAAAPVAQVVAPTGGAQADALSALTNLGYAPVDAARAVAEVADDADDAGALIRLALKRLAPGG
ncbi:Holliday junction branch migration protein RuvA [Jannaschia sp. KMU-145]|uniref:Holliday junction branch migration protein RuvA n=1 Tax=Jannaschia halovivens TaxID=3388667 RepID=UPI00396B2899